MDQKKVLDKIKKLLRLSASDNPHEAAAAMRQAKALMRKHQIDQATVETIDVLESSTRSSASVRPAIWEANLAETCARAYASRCLFIGNAGEWLFVGEMAELASYTMSVLLRKLRTARKNYIQENLARCKTANKTRRADLFCVAWVHQIYRQVMIFADATPSAAVDTYMRTNHQDTQVLETNDRNAATTLSDSARQDVMAGRLAAKNVHLNHGVNGRDQVALS